MACQAKTIKVSTDDVNYYTLPGNSASLSSEGEQIEDTIFGQRFSSSETGLIGSSLSTNALYKGFAGYNANILKAGTPIEVTGGATTLVSGNTYQITNTAQRVMATASGYTVYDGAANITAYIESKGLDPFTGTFTLDSSYTVTGTITIDYYYVTLTEVSGATGFDISMSSDVQDSTTLTVAQGNNGHRTYICGLLSVESSVSGLYNKNNGFIDIIKSRETFVIKLAPKNGDADESYAYGFFKIVSDEMTGDVGAIEEDNISLMLYVPYDDKIESPFKWYHPSNTSIPEGTKIILDALFSGAEIYVKYRPLGDTTGESSYDGLAVISDASMSTDLDSMNEFSAELQITGALTENTI